MALQMRVEMDNGIVVGAAYIRVHSLYWSREGTVLASLRYYKDQQSCLSELMFFKEQSIECVVTSNNDSMNWRKQVYESLKGREEFSTAVDVLEDGQ